MQNLSSRLDGARDISEWADHCLHGLEDGAGRAVDHVKRHPIPYALVGISTGWMLFRVFAGRGEKRPPGGTAADAGNGNSEATHGIVGENRETGGAVRENVEHADGDAAARARKATEKVADTAREVRQRLRTGLKDGARQSCQVTDDRQLVIGAGFLAAGLLTGLLLPCTRLEDQWLGSSRDQIGDRLREAGRSALGHGRDVLRETVESALTRACDAPADKGE